MQDNREEGQGFGSWLAPPQEVAAHLVMEKLGAEEESGPGISGGEQRNVAVHAAPEGRLHL